MKHRILPGQKDLNQLLEEAEPGDVFEFASGNFFLCEPLRITRKQNLTLRAEEGARVHLHAGIRVEDWREEGVGLWSAEVPARSCELYADGVRQNPARWPKEAPESDSFAYARSTGTTPVAERKRAFRIDPETLPEIADGETLDAFLWPSGPQGEYNWHSVILPCTRHGDRINLEKDTWFDLGIGTRFYLFNHPALLTEEGEFHIDREALRLWFRPVGGAPRGQTVVLPMMQNLIEVRDSSGIVIEGFDLSGTDRVPYYDGEIFDQDGAAVFITENSANITVRNCEIHHTGLNGVCLYRHARRVTVENCHIHHIGHTGVRAYGDWVSEEYMNRGHLIRNNHIHHLGARVGQCAGVQLLQSGECTIANNLIHHSSRYAISLLAPNTRTFVKPAFFPQEDKVPSFKAKWYTYVRDNLVYRNEMFACNRDSQDTGLIQGFRSGEGNVISDNIVRDSEIHFSFGNGIYLDDCCDGWTVKNNLVYNLNHHGEGTLNNVLTFKGIGNVAENNRFIRNKVGRSGVIDTFSMGDKENYNLEACRNIFHDNGPCLYGNMDWQERRYRKVDGNLFSGCEAPFVIRGGLGQEGELSLTQWQREGLDIHSLTANPRFMDEERDDFRLRYDSPAAGLGIEEIDYSAVGLTGDYPFERMPAQDDPLIRLFPEIRLKERDIAEGRSWVSVRTGDVLKIVWRGRTRNLLVREALTPSLQLVDGDPKGLELGDGSVTPLEKGVYRLCAELEEARCCVDVLVDEEVQKMSWALIPERVVQGDRHPVKVLAHTDTGRVYGVTDPVLRPGPGVELLSGQLYFFRPGKRTVTVEAEGIQQKLVTEVCEDLVQELIPRTPKIAVVGIPQPVMLEAKMRSGRRQRVKQFKVEGNGVDCSGDQLCLNREGEQVLRFSSEGESARLLVRVVPARPLPDGYTLRQYGPEEGHALVAEDGRLHLYSTANNVWYEEDDATFLFREQPSEGLQIEMIVHELEQVHRFVQNGILVRAEDTPESRCIHFRVNTEGELMVAAREGNRATMRTVLGASPWAKFGAAGAEIDDRVAGGVVFPVGLRLEYRDGVFHCLYRRDGAWERLCEVALEMPGTCYAGAGFFSVDAARPAHSVFELKMSGHPPA